MADVDSVRSNLFILYRDSLLAMGLESMLRAGGVSVVQVDLRLGDALRELEKRLQPGDVVIVDKLDTQVHPSLSIMQLFMNNRDISVISMDPQENGVELFQRQGKLVKEPEELLKFIDRCRSLYSVGTPKGGN